MRYKRRDGNACAASSLLVIYSLDRLVPRIAVKFPPAPGRTVGKFALLSRSTGCTMATAKSSDATPKANRNGRSLLGLSGSSSQRATTSVRRCGFSVPGPQEPGPRHVTGLLHSESHYMGGTVAFVISSGVWLQPPPIGHLVGEQQPRLPHHTLQSASAIRGGIVAPAVM